MVCYHTNINLYPWNKCVYGTKKKGCIIGNLWTKTWINFFNILEQKSAIISISPPGNAVSDYFIELAKQLVFLNFNVIIIFDQKWNNFQSENHKIISYSWPNSRPTGFLDLRFAFKIIYRHKPSLIISNFGATNTLAMAGYLLNVKHRLNYIHTLSEQIDMDVKKSRLKNKLLHFRKSLFYSLHTQVLTNSNGNKFDFSKKFNFEKRRILMLPILIKKHDLIAPKSQREQHDLIIVGRLSLSKGHDMLLRQFKYLLDSGLNLKLNIVGNGPERHKLQKLVKKLQIFKHVFFHGNLSRDKVLEMLTSSMISISSSREEAYGLVNIEALSTGTPLVMTKSAGGLDILENGINGEFFDLNEASSLQNSINKILHDWDFYSCNALKKFKNNYDMRNAQFHAKMLLDFLK